MSHIDDKTTKQMIVAAVSRGAKPEAESVSFALLDARFRAFEISMRLDAVIAGVRAIRGTVTVPVLDVA
jgi:2-keto-3-deoxy-6-phosphogluconate aldolase